MTPPQRLCRQAFLKATGKSHMKDFEFAKYTPIDPITVVSTHMRVGHREKILFFGRRFRSSLWNAAIVDEIAKDVMKSSQTGGFYKLTLEKARSTLWNCVSSAQRQWTLSRPRTYEDGLNGFHMESPDEVSKRLQRRVDVNRDRRKKALVRNPLSLQHSGR